MSFKPVSFEAIMALSEDAIAETFPLGIVAVAKDRWRPAEEGEEPDKELGELVKAKHDRRERLRLMPRNSTQPPTESMIAALGSATHSTETTLGAAEEPEPEMVDKDTLERYAKENREKDAARKAQIPLYEELRRIEPHLRGSQRAELRKRIEGLKRSTNEKAA